MAIGAVVIASIALLLGAASAAVQYYFSAELSAYYECTKGAGTVEAQQDCNDQLRRSVEKKLGVPLPPSFPSCGDGRSPVLPDGPAAKRARPYGDRAQAHGGRPGRCGPGDRRGGPARASREAAPGGGARANRERGTGPAAAVPSARPARSPGPIGPHESANEPDAMVPAGE